MNIRSRFDFTLRFHCPFLRLVDIARNEIPARYILQAIYLGIDRVFDRINPTAATGRADRAIRARLCTHATGRILWRRRGRDYDDDSSKLGRDKTRGIRVDGQKAIGKSWARSNNPKGHGAALRPKRVVCIRTAAPGQPQQTASGGRRGGARGRTKRVR